MFLTGGKQMVNDFVLMIKVTDEGSDFKASGDMDSGKVRIMIGNLEIMKSRLIHDLEKSEDSC